MGEHNDSGNCEYDYDDCDHYEHEEYSEFNEYSEYDYNQYGEYDEYNPNYGYEIDVGNNDGFEEYDEYNPHDGDHFIEHDGSNRNYENNEHDLDNFDGKEAEIDGGALGNDGIVFDGTRDFLKKKDNINWQTDIYKVIV